MYSTAKILIVDDEQSIRDVLEQIISRGLSGTTPLFIHAENGQVALDILKNNPDVDVITLDLNMPVMDGFETLARLRADLRLQTIPVFVFSGNKGDATKALKLGARDFINKPGDYNEIRIRVLNLIESKRRTEAGELAKTNFLSTISHELRTPMNGVEGATQLLQTTELTDEQTEYVEMLEKSANDMMTIIDNCLNFLQSENPLHNLPVVTFDLRTTVQESIASLAFEAKKNRVTVMDVEIHPDIPENLTGLPDKLQLIFHHLLSNAIKFSPAGKVVARIEPGEREEQCIQLNCSVTDTGIGVTPETQSVIFEPFTQADGSTKRAFGGLGIGLSIASRVVQMMGGSILVAENPGGGSRFSFTVSCGIACG
jgi:signal transduction histidine kinase